MSYYSLRTQRDLREMENHLLLLPMTQPTTATNGRDEHRLSKLGLETVGAQWGSQWVGRFPCSIQRWVVPAAALARAPSPQLTRLPVHSQTFGLPAFWWAAGQAPAAAGAWWRLARKPGKTLVCAGATHACRCREKKILLFHKSCFGSAGDWSVHWAALRAPGMAGWAHLCCGRPQPPLGGNKKSSLSCSQHGGASGPNAGSQSRHYTVESKKKNTFPALMGNVLAPTVLWA